MSFIERFKIEVPDFLVFLGSRITEDAPVSSEEGSESATSIELFLKLNTCIEYLNLSILAGEYFKIENYKEIITDLKDSLFRDSSDFDSGIEVAIISHLHFALGMVEGFLRLLEYKYEAKKEDDYYLDGEVIWGIDNDNHHIESKTPQSLRLLSINISLAVIDNRYVLSELTIKRLIHCFHQLSNINRFTHPGTVFNVRDILKEKCRFLIRKFRYSNLKYSEIKYSSNNKLYSIRTDKGNNIFADVESRCKSYYELEQNSIAESEPTSDQTNRFFRFYLLAKHFKDSEKSPKKISDLFYETFRIPEFGGEAREFNNYALKILRNNLLNHQLSALIANFNYEKNINSEGFGIDKLNEIHDLFIKIKGYQKTTSIKNFFPYRKFAEFLLDYLEKVIQTFESNIEVFNNTKFFDEQSKRLQEIIDDLQNSNQWCTDRWFLPIQVSFDESVTKLITPSKDELNLFLNSSFVKPVDLNELNEKTHSIIKRADSINTRITEINNSLKLSEMTSLKFDESMKKESAKQTRDQVTILGIFSALALFTISNIQVFMKIQTVEHALLFTISFAYCFIVFGLFIRLVVVNKYVTFKYLLLDLVYLVVFLVLSYYVFRLILDWPIRSSINQFISFLS